LTPGRVNSSPLRRLLDSASRRDFIYLVILLALLGRSNWFLVIAGISAPIYFFLVPNRSRRAQIRKRSVA
jgi:hypothetical protein